MLHEERPETVSPGHPSRRAATRASSAGRAPYSDALRRHAAAAPLNLMVPGHGCDPARGGRHLAEVIGAQAVELDVPLMLEGIDLGEGAPLAEALALAAEAWGARRTWFLTNGASQGNRTAALAVRGLGERVLMQRSSHSSFTDGVLLAGLMPAFIAPSVDEYHGIAHGLTPEALEGALQAEARAGRAPESVYVVSPSYFGSTADVAGLARVAHAHDAAIIVDGAWGAHFGFHPDLPESPARLGADLVISSTHKLAGSLTQSAMLHLGDGPLADRLEPLVARAHSMTASTSTSALLIASLDTARAALVSGRERIARAIGFAEELRGRIRADARFGIISDDFGPFPDIVASDALRIAIDVTRLGRSGHWVRERLSGHGVYAEMSTATSVVVVVGALAEPDIDRAVAAFAAVATEAESIRSARGEVGGVRFPALPAPGPLRIRPRDAFFGPSAFVAASDAVGRISADTLAAYPPGIPNLIPGEEITAETIEFLQAVAASPTGYVRGAADAIVSRFLVER